MMYDLNVEINNWKQRQYLCLVIHQRNGTHTWYTLYTLPGFLPITLITPLPVCFSVDPCTRIVRNTLPNIVNTLYGTLVARALRACNKLYAVRQSVTANACANILGATLSLQFHRKGIRNSQLNTIKRLLPVRWFVTDITCESLPKELWDGVLVSKKSY